MDHPFDEVARGMKAQIARGADCYQKFTCRGCGSRQTMGEPNVMYPTGKCEECGAITDIRAQGCNFLLVMRMR